MNKIILVLGMAISSFPIFSQGSDTFIDPRDGKSYKTVKIDSQNWMAENLAYKTNSGYNECEKNDSTVVTYGYHYDWRAAKAACPEGWHLPSYAEWMNLINYLGGKNVAGDKLKEAGTSHWNSPNTGATNESGFTALPSGYCNSKGIVAVGYSCLWWSATKNDATYIRSFCLLYNESVASREDLNKIAGISVRCIKD